MKQLTILCLVLTVCAASSGCRCRGWRCGTRGAPCRTYPATAAPNPYQMPTYQTFPAQSFGPTAVPCTPCPPMNCYDSGFSTQFTEPGCGTPFGTGTPSGTFDTFPMDPGSMPPSIDPGTIQSTRFYPVPGKEYFSHVVGDHRVESQEQLTSSGDES